jgi:3-phenylpropionate/trans-cinnamate dioxygenase ferredoxin component
VPSIGNSGWPMSEKIACRASDLAPGKALRADLKRDDGVVHAFAIVRSEDGDVYAIDDTCSHADYSLSEGDVWGDECEIECPKHGSTFSLLTGEPQTLPATRPVAVYEVVVEGDDVKVVVP